MTSGRTRLAEVVAVFGRLGCTAFGGPAAHVAMQEEECVRRRGWLDHQRFLDMLAATNLIPGPNSTEMAIHLGRLRAGWPGLVAGGVAFVLPSAVLVTVLAAAYARVGAVPRVEIVLATLRPAVVVVVAAALVRLARQAIGGGAQIAIAALALVASLAGLGEVSIVVLAAVAGVLGARFDPSRLRAVPLAELGLVCLKIGATMFGSGYVLIAYLRAELAAHGWLSDRALLDAVAIGQVTPGPVSTAATFVGYLLAGVPGAAVATVAIFLPAFVLVAATGPLLERWRDRPAVRRTLDVVNAAVVGLIAAVLVRLAPAALAGPIEIAIALASGAALWALDAGSTAVFSGVLIAGVVRALVAR
ncbi:MAG TPA: chromate transporter [Candidatus Eisenbacteria bacterium]|nr:chromate transporter [Candidatus Eisenbacteria bacterium]